MPKYCVSGEVTISTFTIVEADSPEKAKEIADERGMVGLCYQCGGTELQEEEWVTSGELDGTPKILAVEEE